jgi:hypothetical protein
MSLCKIIPPPFDSNYYHIFGPFTHLNGKVYYRLWHWDPLLKEPKYYPGITQIPGLRDQIKVPEDSFILNTQTYFTETILLKIQSRPAERERFHVCMFDSQFFLVPDSMLRPVEYNDIYQNNI